MADLKESAPRITPADIEANIDECYYFTALGGALSELPRGVTDAQIDAIPYALDRLTFCVLVLKNGFIVTGESYLSPENFDPVVGCMIAREKAIEKIRPLKGV